MKFALRIWTIIPRGSSLIPQYQPRVPSREAMGIFKVIGMTRPGIPTRNLPVSRRTLYHWTTWVIIESVFWKNGTYGLWVVNKRVALIIAKANINKVLNPVLLLLLCGTTLQNRVVVQEQWATTSNDLHINAFPLNTTTASGFATVLSITAHHMVWRDKTFQAQHSHICSQISWPALPLPSFPCHHQQKGHWDPAWEWAL